jgi:23S rRNA (pseudouridine1915-N3)-methyltransferase
VKLTVVAVGRPGALLADAIGEYERRAQRYWPLDFVEVRQERGSRGNDEAVREAESKRAIDRVPPGHSIFALTRTGDPLSSARLARLLDQMATEAQPGAAFLIGGALGLSVDALRMADRRLRLSTMTLPHDLARLVLAEQLYRAGTISRREPYHKGGE